VEFFGAVDLVRLVTERTDRAESAVCLRSVLMSGGIKDLGGTHLGDFGEMAHGKRVM